MRGFPFTAKNQNLVLPDSATGTRFGEIRLVLIRVLFLNLFVAGAKILVGLFTSTLSMIADGFHSLVDSASNIVGLIGVSVAARPPDSNHPYGHHKYETLASLVIGAMVLLTAGGIIREVIVRMKSPVHPDVSWLNLAVMLATMGVNFGVSTYEFRKAKKLNSDILAADALQTRSDIFVSAGVLAAMMFIWLGYPWVDSAAALLVTSAVLYSAWLIFHRAATVLTDSTTLDPVLVESAALGVSGVLSVEKIRSRGREQQLSVDMHIRVDPNITITEAHQITHDVRAAVESSTGARDVVIHTEPEPASRKEGNPGPE